jgi:hypothetical protein
VKSRLLSGTRSCGSEAILKRELDRTVSQKLARANNHDSGCAREALFLAHPTLLRDGMESVNRISRTRSKIVLCRMEQAACQAEGRRGALQHRHSPPNVTGLSYGARAGMRPSRICRASGNRMANVPGSSGFRGWIMQELRHKMSCEVSKQGRSRRHSSGANSLSKSLAVKARYAEKSFISSRKLGASCELVS